MSSTYQSPAHALGFMVIQQFNKITEVLPNCLKDPDGPKEIYMALIGLDGMLVSYRDKMSYAYIENGKVKHRGYYLQMDELNKQKKDLRWTNTNDAIRWADWFHAYLVTLSSCFNTIGLAPMKNQNELVWGEEAFEPSQQDDDKESWNA